MRDITCDLDEIGTSSNNGGKRGAEVYSMMMRCKALARKIKARDHVLWLTKPQLGDSIPVRNVADQLVDLYLNTFESTYLVLHIPSFHAEYAQYWESPSSADFQFVVKLLLVMAIGSTFYNGE